MSLVSPPHLNQYGLWIQINVELSGIFLGQS